MIRRISLRWLIFSVLIAGVCVGTYGYLAKSERTRLQSRNELLAAGFDLAFDRDSVKPKFQNFGFGGASYQAIEKMLTKPGELMDAPRCPQWSHRMELSHLTAPITYAGREWLSVHNKHYPENCDDTLKALAKLKDLEEVNLRWNPVSDEGILHLEKLTKLEQLELEGTDIGDAALRSIAKLHKLKYLSLRNTAISDRGMAHLADLKSLEILILTSCKISDQSVSAINELKNLKELSLSDTRITESGIRELHANQSLTYLDLSYINVGDDSMKDVVAKFPNLESLDLDGTLISDDEHHICRLKKLVSLSARYTKIGDQFISSLPSQRWSSLILDGTRVTDASFEKLLRLQPMDFSCFDTEISFENEQRIVDAAEKQY